MIRLRNYITEAYHCQKLLFLWYQSIPDKGMLRIRCFFCFMLQLFTTVLFSGRDNPAKKRILTFLAA